MDTQGIIDEEKAVSSLVAFMPVISCSLEQIGFNGTTNCVMPRELPRGNWPVH